MGDREGAMARNLSKCVFVLLVLALSGLIFLLRNIHSDEVRTGTTADPCHVFPTMGSSEGTEDMRIFISSCRTAVTVYLCPSFVRFPSSLFRRT